MLQTLRKTWLFARLVAYIFGALTTHLRRSLQTSLSSRQPPVADGNECRNIVVAGAAFAGYHAARIIASSLPRPKPGSPPYRVVVVEPNSHFNFTWVLPRFCVVAGHEHKAFIPYGGYFGSAAVRWIRSRVDDVTPLAVRLRDGSEIPYAFLVVATGATVPDGLPSRVGSEDKTDGVQLLRGFQQRIRDANNVVVAGGGAAGVEVATDAKSQYPHKNITLVHSRQAAMHRFSPGLQKETHDAFDRLGVRTILEAKVVSHDSEARTATLTSGETIDCDCFVDCTGQKPASGLLSRLAPAAISPSGLVRVKPTLQIDDNALSNIYACGDVADTGVPNPNARSAMRQAEIVADNVLLAVRGQTPEYTYAPLWGDCLIKLTLGLDRSVVQFWDGQAELLFCSKEASLDLMSSGAWKNLGAKPFEDDSFEDVEAAK